MEKKNQGKALSVVLLVYIVCVVFRLFEYFILRTDKTWVGEAVVHKLIGIAILFFAVRMQGFSWKDIGFVKENSMKYLLKGLAFGSGIFAIAYAVETLIVMAQGRFDSLQFYVSAYAVDENIGYQTGFVFFLICVLGNVVNVIMEEGIFRGLFIRILEKKYRFILVAAISSVLFGLWHMVAPVRNYVDGTTSIGGMIANIIMLVVTSALVGFKFALLTKITGSLYMAMGDHFVNNTIVNLLHVVSITGADEMMVLRVAIAQSLSCVIVLVYYVLVCRIKEK